MAQADIVHDMRDPAPTPGWRRRLRENWIWIALLGAALIAGGVVAIALPVMAGIAVTTVVGAAMILGAVLQGVHAFRDVGGRARAFSLLSAAVYLIGGALLLFNPFAGTVALSLLMLAIFIVDGAVRIAMGLRMRPDRGWGWMTGSGLVTAALALVIAIWFLPGASLSLLGVVAGVNLILEGWAFLFVAFAFRPRSDRMVRPDATEQLAPS